MATVLPEAKTTRVISRRRPRPSGPEWVVHRPHLRLVEPEPTLDQVLAGRDSAFIRRIFPPMAALVDHYYRASIEGAENLSDAASLYVSTHNGGPYTPDMYALFVSFWRRFGLETPAYGLMHRFAFDIPMLGPALTKVGAIHASRDNGRAVLRAGFPLLVCPGGDLDALKPFSQRHKIVFGNRKGFVRLAIEQQVPIVPIVSVGAHEAFFVLHDGRRVAELIGFRRFLRVKSVPLVLCAPFGITPAGIFALPLPTKVTLRVLPRIELAERPSAANDDAVVDRCFDHVTSVMQRGLSELASRRRFPVLG